MRAARIRVADWPWLFVFSGLARWRDVSSRICRSGKLEIEGVDLIVPLAALQQGNVAGREAAP